jgi:hypothetical protein
MPTSYGDDSELVDFEEGKMILYLALHAKRHSPAAYTYIHIMFNLCAVFSFGTETKTRLLPGTAMASDVFVRRTCSCPKRSASKASQI